MNANTGGGIWRQIRNGLTDRGFLKRIGVTRKAMQAAFEASQMKAAAEQVGELMTGQAPVDIRKVTEAVLPLLDALCEAGEIERAPAGGDWLEYAYETMRQRMFPPQDAKPYSGRERPGAFVLCELLRLILLQERRTRPFDRTFDIDLLTETEARKCVSGNEYFRFLDCCREYYFHEFHAIASAITPEATCAGNFRLKPASSYETRDQASSPFSAS